MSHCFREKKGGVDRTFQNEQRGVGRPCCCCTVESEKGACFRVQTGCLINKASLPILLVRAYCWFPHGFQGNNVFIYRRVLEVVKQSRLLMHCSMDFAIIVVQLSSLCNCVIVIIVQLCDSHGVRGVGWLKGHPGHQ